MKGYMQESFFQVPMETGETSEGSVEFPVLYFDSSCVTAFFRCDIDRIKNQLAGLPLKAGLVMGKQAVVGISFYEYRETSIGPYNEVGVAIPVIHEGQSRPLLPLLDLYMSPEKRKIGFYVIDLPVTTAAANAAGREMWGLPKFVTRIPFELQGRQFSGAVLDPDTEEPIVTFEGKMGMGLPSPALHLKLYSFLENKTLETIVNVHRGAPLHSKGSMKLAVGASSHPMAERLRTLGLDGKSPVALIATQRFQSRLNLGIARL